jgi:PQQ-dependent dehydrogenase (s-GDH family)
MAQGRVVRATVLSCALAVGCTQTETAGPGDAGRPGDAGGMNGPERFVSRVVATGLAGPWEVTWGPDGYLWLTERTGKRVMRVRPSDGARATAFTIAEVHQSAPQDGLLGMALHSRLLTGTGHDHVYVAYTYDADPGPQLDRRTKIRRYTYDAVSQGFGQPVDLITNLPASYDHNAGRLIFGPDERLYYTIGEGGNNQFENTCLPIRAQELPTAADVSARDWSKYQGKVLRLDLDGSIPEDNPVLSGVRSHVYSYGHRNPQGIVFGPDGLLYASEHGPKTDDEVNLIQAGKNYGWPHVVGYQDDQAYVYGNWSASSPTPCEALEFSNYDIPGSVPQQKESEWCHPDFAPPIATFYTVPSGHEFRDPACAGGSEYICWPTIAPASLDVYAPKEGGIPGWTRALLVPSLKQGSVFRARLSEDGRSIVGDPVPLFKTTNRYRDITVAPDSRTFYVITDPGGLTGGPTGGSTAELENPGAILEFKYTGGDDPR